METTTFDVAANRSSRMNIASFSADRPADDARSIDRLDRTARKLCGSHGPPILKAMSSSVCAADSWTAASNRSRSERDTSAARFAISFSPRTGNAMSSAQDAPTTAMTCEVRDIAILAQRVVDHLAKAEFGLMGARTLGGREKFVPAPPSAPASAFDDVGDRIGNVEAQTQTHFNCARDALQLRCESLVMLIEEKAEIVFRFRYRCQTPSARDRTSR